MSSFYLSTLLSREQLEALLQILSRTMNTLSQSWGWVFYLRLCCTVVDFYSLFPKPAEVEIQNMFYVCDSKSCYVALGILYGYKAILQVIALTFSFSIGKIKIKGLNDAKFIAVAVYVTSVVTTVIFVSLYSLKTYLNLYAMLFSFGFFVGTTFILVLVFLPKVCDPKKNNRTTKHSYLMNTGRQFYVISVLCLEFFWVKVLDV